MDAGMGFRTRNTCLENGHRGRPFIPLCAPRKGLGNGRKIITKCKALMKPWKLTQLYKLQSRNHAMYTVRRAPPLPPDYVFKMIPHIGIITLFRLMMLETIRAITALKMISTI